MRTEATDKLSSSCFGSSWLEPHLVRRRFGLAFAVVFLGAGSTTGPGSFEQQMLDAGADWALNEECNQYDECVGYTQFISAGKVVFPVEYPDNQRTLSRALRHVCQGQCRQL